MIIKVCGMRETLNLQAVEQTGADWIGFVCYEHSPRYVADRPSYLPRKTRRIGVFVNATADFIRKKIEELQLDFVQLHGNESPEFCQMLQSQGISVIKAFSFTGRNELQQTNAYENCCSYFLFDTPCLSYGGSGQSFDWSLLDAYEGHTSFLLSGGLNPASIPALGAFHHPRWAGIDLNSGFETAPALKDSEALKIFIKQFKALQL